MNLTDAQSPAEMAARVPTAPQVAAMRQQGSRLLLAGFLGAHLLGIAALIVLGVVFGLPGALSGALGVVIVLLYRIVGHMITMSSSRLATGQQLLAAMGSLALRVMVLLALGALWFSLPAEVTGRLEIVAIAIGILAAELGWLAGLMLSGMRSRLPIYDDPDASAHNANSAAKDRSEVSG